MENAAPRETDDPNDLPKSLLLAAPLLHAALLPSWAPAGTRCFNPGILSPKEMASEAAQYFTSPELPLTQQQARAQLQDLLDYASMHNKPGELSSIMASGTDRPFASSTFDFKNELVDVAKISGKALPPDIKAAQEEKEDPDPELVRSQLTLLLAWMQEERLMELGHLTQKLNQAWENFDQTLGLERTDASGIAELGADAYDRSFNEDSPANTQSLPWKIILQHMLQFVPSGTWLLFFDTTVQTVFEEGGITFEPATNEATKGAFPQGSVSGQLAHVTAAELLGKKMTADAALASKSIKVFFPAGPASLVS